MRTLSLAVRACLSGLVVSFLLATTLAACSSGPPPTPCTTAGATACTKACSCGGGKCAIVLPSMDDAGIGGALLTFNSQDDCTAEYTLVCGNSPQAATVDFNACQAGLTAAACGADPSGMSSGQGVVLPAACAPLW